VVPITNHYNCWWLLWTRGFTVSSHIFYKQDEDEVSDRLRRHEETHVGQYIYLTIPGFLACYVTQWVCCGFRYSKIPLEIEAIEAEKSA